MGKLSLNQAGSSMVEVLIGGAMIVAVGVGVMQLSKTQEKASKGTKIVSSADQFMGMVRETLADPSVCKKNFLAKKVNNDEKLTELINAKGDTVVKVGEKYAEGAYELVTITIGKHNANAKRTQVILDFKKRVDATRSTDLRRIFSSFTAESGGVITECLDPIELSAFAAMKKMCMDADPVDNKDCEDNITNLVAEVKRLYCSSSGLPFILWDAGAKKCVQIDAGKVCGSGYLQGFDRDGNLICYTPPT